MNGDSPLLAALVIGLRSVSIWRFSQCGRSFVSIVVDFFFFVSYIPLHTSFIFLVA